VRRAFQLHAIEDENKRLEEKIGDDRTVLGTMVTAAPEMSKVARTIERVASSDLTRRGLCLDSCRTRNASRTGRSTRCGRAWAIASRMANRWGCACSEMPSQPPVKRRRRDESLP
jgi:hypothetical protein